MLAYINYCIFRAVVMLFSGMPFGMIYRISDGVAFLLHRILKYRSKLVFDNLRRSFPDKSAIELNRIAEAQYRNLADIMIESFKGFSMSLEEIRARYTFTNPELLHQNVLSNGNCILMAAHYSNWEWGAVSIASYLHKTIVGFYKPLKNKYIDNYMKSKRSFGDARLESIFETKQVFEKYAEQASAFVFIADQNPSSPHSHWVKFLNQDTVCLHGGDKYARMYDYPVYFLDMNRVGRGRYSVTIEVLVLHPAACAEGDITRLYMSRLERKLIENPDNWLWTHRRWKHKKPASTTN